MAPANLEYLPLYMRVRDVVIYDKDTPIMALNDV